MQTLPYAFSLNGWKNNMYNVLPPVVWSSCNEILLQDKFVELKNPRPTCSFVMQNIYHSHLLRSFFTMQKKLFLQTLFCAQHIYRYQWLYSTTMCRYQFLTCCWGWGYSLRRFRATNRHTFYPKFLPLLMEIQNRFYSRYPKEINAWRNLTATYCIDLVDVLPV